VTVQFLQNVCQSWSTFACYEFCGRGSDQKWSWENVEEPNFINCNCAGSPILYTKPILSLLARKRHRLMASKLAANFAYIQAGMESIIRSDEDLMIVSPTTAKATMGKNKKVKVEIRFQDGTSGLMFCEHRHGIDYCKSAKKTKEHQRQNATVERKIDSIMGDRTSTWRIVWADDTNILLVVCYGIESYSGWSLTSTSYKLSKKTRKTVLLIVASLGFDPKEAVVFPRRTTKHKHI